MTTAPDARPTPSAPRRAWRWLQWGFGLTVALFVVLSLRKNWEKLLTQRVAWDVTPGYLVAALLLTWAMYALLIQAWRVMLAGWRQPLPAWPAARIWTVSGLGKYIPGQVWAIASMAVMAQRVGIAPWAATASSVLLQGLAIGTGAAVLGATGMELLRHEYPLVRAVVVLLVIGSVAGVALLLWPPFVRRALRALRVETHEAGVPGVASILFGAVANVLAWIGYGIAFWLVARGLFATSALTLPLAIGTFTAAYLAGFLAFGVPAGVGVREAIILTMLQATMGPAAALALAAVSRIVSTVAELGAATPFLLHRGERSRAVH
ncbi:MAG TPA: lysylphosphatidylglycerol synthase domain-containing protein [Gemmatimonadales bacterium]|nr:lysylphosphatidylglycerol synthase domain-containing protein [Gemmatimonadales bacterium]